MSDRYAAVIDLARMAAKMSADRGKAVNAEQAAQWLKENGFERVEDHWEAEAPDIALLDESEVLNVWDVEGSEAEEAPEGWAPPPKPPPYVLSAERRRELQALPEYELCTIPRFLCGRPRDVIRRWKAVVRRAIEKKGFAAALAGAEFVHVDDAPGSLMTRQDRGFSCGPDNIILFPLWADFFDLVWEASATGDLDATQRLCCGVMATLTIDALDEFWFGLVFGSHPFWPPITTVSEHPEVRQIGHIILRKMLRWWPHLCARNDRFASTSGDPYPFPHWGCGLFDLLGLPDSWDRVRNLDCKAAGEVAASFLEELGHDAPSHWP